MLVLSRKTEQTVIIDGQVEIKVLGIKGQVVKLGVAAPKSIKVLRGELSTGDFKTIVTRLEPSSLTDCQLAKTLPR